MDKSIDERAENYVKKVISELDPQFKYDDGDFHFYDTNLEEAYIQGATEQEPITRKATIADVCEWLKEHINDYLAVGNTDYGKPYDIHLVSDELFTDLRKHFEG